MKKYFFCFTFSLFISFGNLYSQILPNQTQTITPSMQPINVTIGGDFIVEGTFQASPSERVDQFITRIFNESRNQILAAVNDQQTFLKLYQQTQNYAKRGIKLVRYDGSEKILDLLKFRLTGDFLNNPYLQNDDVLIFPTLDLENNFIKISGAVNDPQKFNFVEGDKLSDAILLAGGIDKTFTDVNFAEISRLSQDGMNEEVLQININDNANLQAGDRITIIGDPSLKESYSVLVMGEVKHPGVIYIKKDSTKLFDVMKKAGGFKETAYLDHAEIIKDKFASNELWKNYLKDEFEENPTFSDNKMKSYLDFMNEYERLAMLRMAYINQEDSVNFFLDNELRIQQTRSEVDFNNLNDPNSEASNHIVKSGDVIIVPTKPNYIYVFGQVGTIGYYKFGENKNYRDYLKEAGGISEYAKGDIFLIRSQSREWIDLKEKEDIKIKPGDYIYIPKDIPRSFWYYVSRVGTIASILGSVATVVLLFNQLGK